MTNENENENQDTGGEENEQVVEGAGAPAEGSEPAPQEATQTQDDLPDDVVWKVLASPKASQAIADILGQQMSGFAAPGSEPASDAGEEDDADESALLLRYKQGDGEAALELLRRQERAKEEAQAQAAAIQGARTKIWGAALEGVEELKDLGIDERARLLKAFVSGDGPFLNEVNTLVAERRAGTAAAATTQKQEVQAAKGAEIAAAQETKTPVMPEAQSSDGPPPIDPSKSPADVFSDFFEWEAQKNASPI